MHTCVHPCIHACIHTCIHTNLSVTGGAMAEWGDGAMAMVQWCNGAMVQWGDGVREVCRVYVYIYIYSCIHSCIYVCMRVYVDETVYVYAETLFVTGGCGDGVREVCIHTYMPSSMHTYMYTYMHTYMHIHHPYIHSCIYMCMCVYVHEFVCVSAVTLT
jgi:hypothetical protein